MMVLLCNDTGCEMAAYSLSEEDGHHKEIALSRAVAAGWAELETNLRQWMKKQFGEAFNSLDPDLTAANSQFMITFEQHVSSLTMETSDWKPAFLPLHLICKSANPCYDGAGYVILPRCVRISPIGSSYRTNDFAVRICSNLSNQWRRGSFLAWQA